MAGYTLKNLKNDVEDMAPKFDRPPQEDWPRRPNPFA